MRKNAYPDLIQDIRDRLDNAARQPQTEAQVGMIMIAVSQLLDLTECLYQCVVDREKVQNERGEK